VRGYDLLKSTDYGDNWSRIPGTGAWGITVNPANAEELLMRKTDGLYRSSDGGRTSSKIGPPGSFRVNKFDFNRISVWGANDAGDRTLFRTSDGGATWNAQVIGTLPGTVSAVDIDPADDDTIYAGGNLDLYIGSVHERHAWIMKSTNSGLSWSYAFYGYDIRIYGIWVDPVSPNRIFAGSYPWSVISKDYGATWQHFPQGQLSGIAVNPFASNEIYAAVNSEIIAPRPDNGVWSSADGGETWTQMNEGLTVTSVSSLAANWTNRILYASALSGGIFRTYLPGPPDLPTISGVVKTAGGEGSPGVLLTFSDGGGTVTTGPGGYYMLAVPVGWSGTVAPAKAGSTFIPADRSYANVTANQAGEDYTEYVHMVSTPTTPTGQPRGEKDVMYMFTSGVSACSLGHGVEYQYDWGDGSVSGWSAAPGAAHSWAAPGDYVVKVRVRCSVDTGLVSGWSEGTRITILSQYTEADKHAVGDFDGDGLDEAAVDFGTLGVWLWNGGTWTQLTSSNSEHLIAGNLDGDADDEIAGDFGSDGIWVWNSGSWWQLSSQNAEFMTAANIDGDTAEELVVDLGHLGIWLWNGGTWSPLTADNPEYLMAADADGDAADEITSDFGTKGLWLWNAGTWTQLTEDDPEYFIGADTTGDSRGEIVADFGSLGLWSWEGGSWTFLTGDNAEFLAADRIGLDKIDALAVDFGGRGLFLRSWMGWSFLSPNDPEFLCSARLSSWSTEASFIVDFGNLGLWSWSYYGGKFWTRLTSDNPQYLMVANIDGGNDQELIVDFGPLGLFLWNNNAWTCLTESNPE